MELQSFFIENSSETNPPKLTPPQVVETSYQSITFKWGTFYNKVTGEVDIPNTESLPGRVENVPNVDDVHNQTKSCVCISHQPLETVPPKAKCFATSLEDSSDDSPPGKNVSIDLAEKHSLLYTLEIESPATKNWELAYRGYAQEFTVGDLKGNTAYTFRLNAATAAGTGPWSSSVVAVTNAEPILGREIHRFIRFNDVEMLMNAIKKGHAPINAPNKFGHSPLMEACLKESEELVEVLVNGGADLEWTAESGKTCMLVVCYAGKVRMAEILRLHGAKLNAVDRSGCSVLHVAADGGHADIAEWAINHGADLELKDNIRGWTPLHRTAAVSGETNVAKVLLAHGAKVDAKDRDGKTSLIIAVCNNHQALVEVLLKNGADTKFKNEHGKTAYDMAVALGRRVEYCQVFASVSQISCIYRFCNTSSEEK